MSYSMFKYSGWANTYSGRIIAVYHPRIKLGLCHGEGDGKGCGKLHAGDGTDAVSKSAGSARKLAPFGSAYSKAVVGIGIENVRKTPVNFVASLARMMEYYFRQVAASVISENPPIDSTRAMAGMSLVRDEYPWEGSLEEMLMARLAGLVLSSLTMSRTTLSRRR